MNFLVGDAVGAPRFRPKWDGDLVRPVGFAAGVAGTDAAYFDKTPHTPRPAPPGVPTDPLAEGLLGI